ncbi:MAG: hypothetical protein KDE31_34060, partial [Caldilineaceae bacterium]|nr:hypothetical protein [Caldilineaceae bacterium]
RVALATLLWPDVAEPTARKNLRDIIFNLRKLLGDQLTITRQTMAINRAASQSVDAVRFCTLLQPQVEACSMQELQDAVALYQGDLLDGFHVRDAEPFEDWLLVEREQLHLLVSHAMHRLVAYYLDTGLWHEGLQLTQRLLAMENWDEAAHRQQMRLLVANGQRGAALTQYERCRHILQEELGIEPAQETQALYRSIQTGELGAQLQTQQVKAPLIQEYVQDGVSIGNVGTLYGLQHDLAAVPQQALFIGRQTELRQLEDAVLRQHKRLLAVVGLGGQGKTALVAQFVTNLRYTPFPRNGANSASPFKRVLWCACHYAPTLSEVLVHWLQLLSINVTTADMLHAEQLLQLLFTHLRHERVAIVLDNFESFLTDDVKVGAYRRDSLAFEHLLERFASASHQSVLILTSREQPL